MRTTVSNIMAAALLGAMSTTAALAQEDDQVVATVNGAEITLADIQLFYSELPEQYRQLPFEMLYENLLDNAIDGVLLLHAAEAESLDQDPDLEAEVQRFRERTMQRLYLEQAMDAALTDERLQALYDEMVADIPADEEIKARHILLENEDEALAVIAELDGGADFATLAQERSTGPSGPQGGDLGWFTRGRMVPEFEEAAFALETGSYSAAPVQSQFGWHVIMVEERREVPKPTFEELRSQLENELSQEVVNDVLADLREGVEIEKFAMDGSPLAEDSGEDGAEDGADDDAADDDAADDDAADDDGEPASQE